MTTEKAPLEVQALVRIMGELSYYQLLHIEADVPNREIKRAYYATARTFHPDSNRHLESKLRKDCHLISKRITEAYCVLRDPRKRQAYDLHLSSGAGLRMQLAAARAAHAKEDAQARSGRTTQGRQFLRKAEEALARGEAASVIQNLQMALTFEPDNEHFKNLLEAARKKAS